MRYLLGLVNNFQVRGAVAGATHNSKDIRCGPSACFHFHSGPCFASDWVLSHQRSTSLIIIVPPYNSYQCHAKLQFHAKRSLLDQWSRFSLFAVFLGCSPIFSAFCNNYARYETWHNQ